MSLKIRLPLQRRRGRGDFQRGVEAERKSLRRLIDDTAFGIASLEVFSENEGDSTRTRAVASYARYLLEEIDRRDAN